METFLLYTLYFFGALNFYILLAESHWKRIVIASVGMLVTKHHMPGWDSWAIYSVWLWALAMTDVGCIKWLFFWWAFDKVRKM